MRQVDGKPDGPEGFESEDKAPTRLIISHDCKNLIFRFRAGELTIISGIYAKNLSFFIAPLREETQKNKFF